MADSDISDALCPLLPIPRIPAGERWIHGIKYDGLLIRELHHRVKNTLANVRAMMGATARSSGTTDKARTKMGRTYPDTAKES